MVSIINKMMRKVALGKMQGRFKDGSRTVPKIGTRSFPDFGKGCTRSFPDGLRPWAGCARGDPSHGFVSINAVAVAYVGKKVAQAAEGGANLASVEILIKPIPPF